MKNLNQGFTLIELLVVIIIIGILSAIALPSFLNQASIAREAEAIKNLKYILDRQQEYYQENNEFILNWDELSSGITKKSSNYSYTLFDSQQGVGIIINSRNEDLRSYLGGIKVAAIQGRLQFLVAKCQSIKRGDILKSESFLVGKNQVLCGKRVEPIR